MTVGVELTWQICPDGSEIVDYGNAHPDAEISTGETLLGRGHPHVAKSGKYIRHRSDQRRTYFRRIDGLNATMIEEFINSRTDDGLVSFVSRFGVPVHEDITRQTYAPEVKLENIASWRDALLEIIELHEAGDEAASVELFNSRCDQMKGAALKPRLSRWNGQPTPMLTLQQANPYGYMLMEAAIAISNATSLRTCTHCGTAFLAGSGTNKRTNAYYCSNRCRVAAQRARASSVSA